jgi:hypothetical protein
MNHDSIGFFYPARSVGGAQYLFARMAEYLLEHTSHEVVLIDYADGFIRSKLGGRDYRFIEYTDGEHVSIREPLLLVFALSFLPIIEQRFTLPETTRLFFWDLHPYNLVEQLALSGIYKLLSPTNAHRMCSVIEHTRCRKLAHFVENGAATHGIAFMAERNRVYNQQLLAFSAPTPYLPIPIDTTVQLPDYCPAKKNGADATIHIGWLSRLDPGKTTVLFRLLDDVRDYQKVHGLEAMHVHVIGDGATREKVEEKCAGINASVAGRLEGTALTEYMMANLHVGFAMGTSALEFAIRGIPTVLTPGGMSQDNLRQTRIYRWLFDSQGYDVAAEDARRPTGLYAFSDIIQQIRDSASEHLADQCRTYAIENHGLRNVGDMFADHLAQCTLTYDDLRRLGIFEYTPYERLLFGAKHFFKKRYTAVPATRRSAN